MNDNLDRKGKGVKSDRISDAEKMTAQMDNDVTGVNIFNDERAKLLWKKELSWAV